jgi:hypothetical protein
MRAFVISLMVVAASPALSQNLAQMLSKPEKSEEEKLIEAEKTECLNREVGRLMQLQKYYSLAPVAAIARDAAHICRGTDVYRYELEQQAYNILYNGLTPAQKDCLKERVEHMLGDHDDQDNHN